jgi:prepilin-type N-terminal cleavage/methylation domain-containing protein
LNSASAKGFTLVEVLVAIVLIGIALTSLSGGLASLTNAYRRSVERDVIHRLAHEKLDELVGTGEWTAVSEGGFEAERYQDFDWSLETETTTIEGLEYVRLTVTKTTGREDSETAEALVFRPADTTVPLEDGGQ